MPRTLYETDIEQLLREELESRGYLKGKDFVQEWPIRLSYIVDIFFPEYNIAVEADGEQFHSSPKARQRDWHKDQIMKAKGWAVLRFPGRQIREDVSECVDRIVNLIQERRDDENGNPRD